MKFYAVTRINTENFISKKFPRRTTVQYAVRRGAVFTMHGENFNRQTTYRFATETGKLQSFLALETSKFFNYFCRPIVIDKFDW